MKSCFWVRSRRGYLSVGASVVAMVAAVPAMADCIPDPTVVNGLTQCSGLDADGLRIITDGTRIQVDAGAIVTRAGDAAITVDMPVMQGPYVYYARSATLDVAGTVEGVSILSGSAGNNYDSYGTRTTVTVAAGGLIGGASGIVASASSDNPYGTTVVRVDNSGTILGLDGGALRSTSPTRGGFDTVINRTGGTMGAIAAPVGTLNNAGTIDGGSASAIAQPSGYNPALRQDLWINSGIIRSNGTAATVLDLSFSQALTNSGIIANAGSGEALKSGAVVLTNTDTGLVQSAGAVAINAGNYLSLVNTGRIAGSVISGGVQHPLASGSRVDSSSGVITGDLILGGSNDTVVARYTGSPNLESGVQGLVDAGDGIDTLQLRTTADTNVGTSITLPASFERLGIDIAADTTTTLGPAFVSPGTVTVSGNGTLANQGIIAAADQALLTTDTSSYPKVINQGVIRTSSGSLEQFGVVLRNGTFSNEGEVRTAGAGITGGSSFANSGNIVSVGTAVSLFSATFSNTGEIRSTDAIAVSLSGTGYGFGAVTQNSGLIDGAIAGVALSGLLVNSGTVSSAQTGVILGWGSTFDNRASGVVSGGARAIGGGDFGGNNSVVLNAGTIRGDVDYTATYTSVYPSNNRFFALPGGILDGDLKLGFGDMLITQAVNTGPGQFAGVSGNVSANNSDLRYQVRSDVSVAHAPIAGFNTIGYELFDNAALKLTNADGATQPVILAGTGSVDMTLDIASTSMPAIQRTSLLVNGGYGSETGVLNIISRGTLSLTRSDPYGYYNVVSLISGDTFENAGIIEVRDATAGAYTPAAGIAGGTVVNSGTINLSNAVGVRNAASFTNTGSILQIAGGGAATGIIDTPTVVNRGTISVDGIAITRSQNFYYPPMSVTNAAGGMITSSGGTAVAISGGTFVNAGSVVGTVDLGFEYNYYSAPTPARTNNSGAYVADGGNVSGDVLFGRGYDTFITKTGETGVSGIIDGGEGSDIFGYDLSSSRTVTFGDNPQIRNFESVMLYARGADTVLTLSSANRVTGSLLVGGQGTVINQASVAERVSSDVPYPLTAADFPIGLARFENQGTLESGISAQIGSFKNTGTIGQYQGLYAYDVIGVDIYNDGKIDFDNEGKISTAVGFDGNSDVSVVNSGTIALGDVYSNAFLPTALEIRVYGETPPNISISNSGTISADLTAAARGLYTTGISISSQQPGTISLNNSAGATISASGRLAFGVLASNGSLTLDNAGTIRGGNVTADGASGAAVLVSEGSAVIRNTGALDGAVLLGSGTDRVENSGTITGLVSLGGGDDTFVQRAGSKLGDTVEGNEGFDSFIVDSTGGTSLAATQLAGFERLLQIGTGTATYAGSFDLDTIELQSGTLAVAAGQSLATTSNVTVTGGDAGVTVQNAGTIAGAVRLGAGNDTYVEYAGSSAGSVDGGAGSDLYRIVLSGNRSGITDGTGFERLAIEGSGTLDVMLKQSYDSVSLTGTNLKASLAGFAIGRLDGSSANEQVVLDGDVAVADLQGGNDLLSLGATRLAGTYQGGAGVDTLRLTSADPVRLDGRIAGFETISMASNALTVAGTLGVAGDSIAFGDGPQALTLATGGTIGGNIDLGAGDDSLFVAAGAVLGGTVQGGAGNDLATFDVTGGRTLSGTLAGFERLATQGSGVLTLSGGTFAFDRVDLASDLAVAPNASLAATQVAFGPAGTRLAIAGGFAGSIIGGAGTDSIDISSGSASAPVALRNLSAVEQLRIGGGLTTISGTASVGSLSLTGGRLIGLAGSTLTAPTITVGTAATFGSAGTVNGNVAVAGTLSPGASPGTMTVNGNVALAGSSTSVFEITPTVSDKLIVNGQLTIAQGATLQIVATEAVRPGQSLDLIVASGGITGSYTNVIKPGSLLGFLVQQDGRLTLRGDFANSATFAPGVQNTITYVNDLLRGGQASSAFLAAVPGLLTQSGATDTGAFARLAPEPYATATQIAVEHGLELAGAARGNAFAAPPEITGGFAFASALGSRRTLQTGDGAADARTRSYGVVGGLGLAGENGSIGAFIGYLDSMQRLKDLAARTEADGLVAGIHGRWSRDQIGIKATIAYDAGKAKTTRMIPGGEAKGRYDLRGWIADLGVDYAVPLSGNWTVRPSLGATAVRVTRDGTVETGASAFVLNVARNRDWAAFVDGALTFEGGQSEGSTVRPYLTLGVRYQFEGRTPYAVAALDRGAFALGAQGVSRAPAVASATLGWDIAVSSRVSVFAAATGESGDADHRFSSRGGVKIAF